ncbi:CRISPR-associated protein Cas4 [Candidatus Woesearchaeota archaeon RBG_13_36_6]|nr:MAG: CRISPR-associated protein Cas4 [Candidatus Woesearchaeota archaeon RBG_13_36_6]
MAISVTTLSSYLYCQRKLYLQKVLGLEEVPKKAIVLGSVRHEVFEKINNTEQGIIESITSSFNEKDILNRYKQEYSKILREVIIKNKGMLKDVDLNQSVAFNKSWPSVFEEALARAENVISFIEKHGIYGKELWQKLTPKIISELKLESENLKLVGVIDQVAHYEETVLPFELKTGSTPKQGVWDSHKIQIGAYILLLREHSKKEINNGFVRYLDSGETREVVMNPFLEFKINELIEKTKGLLNSKTVPSFCNNKNKCSACGLKESCYNEAEINKLIESKWG